MNLHNEFKKQMLQIELKYLQLLCIKEVINSIEHVYGKQNKSWPAAARVWQIEAAKVIHAVMEAQIVTQLIPTTLADKFVPKGYPKETFQFINGIIKDQKRYEALLKEFVPNRVVSDEKLLFFSSRLQSFLRDTQKLVYIFPYEKPSFLIKLFKRNEADYFLEALHQFFNNIKNK